MIYYCNNPYCINGALPSFKYDPTKSPCFACSKDPSPLSSPSGSGKLPKRTLSPTAFTPHSSYSAATSPLRYQSGGSDTPSGHGKKPKYAPLLPPLPSQSAPQSAVESSAAAASSSQMPTPAGSSGADRPFPCPVQGCGSSFKKNSDINRHIKTVHEKSKQYVCSEAGCNASFSYRYELRNHKQTHGSKNVLCPYCGLPFHLDKNLKRHIDTVHKSNSEDRRFKCSICTQHTSFASQTRLTMHLQEVHGIGTGASSAGPSGDSGGNDNRGLPPPPPRGGSSRGNRGSERGTRGTRRGH